MNIDAWLYSDGATFQSYRLASLTRLGRDPSCEIVVDDGKVSRQHARIDLTGGAFVLTDLSRNGVAVNGRRITKPTALSQGDRVRLGDTTLTFTFQPPSRPELDDTVKRLEDGPIGQELVRELITLLDRLMQTWHLRRALVLARPPGSHEQEVFVGRPDGLDRLTDEDREHIATASSGGTVSKLTQSMPSNQCIAMGVEKERPYGVVCVPLGDPEIIGVLYLELTVESPRELLQDGSGTLHALVHALSDALRKRR